MGAINYRRACEANPPRWGCCDCMGGYNCGARTCVLTSEARIVHMGVLGEFATYGDTERELSAADIADDDDVVAARGYVASRVVINAYGHVKGWVPFVGPLTACDLACAFIMGDAR